MQEDVVGVNVIENGYGVEGGFANRFSLFPTGSTEQESQNHLFSSAFSTPFATFATNWELCYWAYLLKMI